MKMSLVCLELKTFKRAASSFSVQTSIVMTLNLPPPDSGDQAFLSVLLSCIRTQSSTRPPDAVTIIIIRLSGESVSASCGTTSGPDPPAEKH
eukprot:superscaffoldBa00005570_g20508